MWSDKTDIGLIMGGDRYNFCDENTGVRVCKIICLHSVDGLNLEMMCVTDLVQLLVSMLSRVSKTNKPNYLIYYKPCSYSHVKPTQLVRIS